MDFSTIIDQDNWVFRLAINHISYLIFVIPVVFLHHLSKSGSYMTWPLPIRTVISPLVRSCILGSSSTDDAVVIVNQPVSHSSNFFDRRRILKLAVSFFGLQISYLLWGLLQERIMTQSYDGEKFDNSQFLVFANRLLAVFVSYTLSLKFCPNRDLNIIRPPIMCFGIISYANCMSTWFQYESLLYISFPVQVIAKSFKTIPVMLVGRCVSGKNYSLLQYFLMIIMAIGVALFLSGYEESGVGKLGLSKKNRKISSITTTNGLILLVFYLGFDAFTSNYQKRVFDRYSIHALTMMFYVNVLSTMITLASLIFSGTLWDCFYFMGKHSLFGLHVIATSLCSSIGQLFIFSTIEEFGPVIFTIIMTMRQAFSILLSCLLYGHHLNWISVVGIQIAFAAIFFQAYNQLKRTKKSTNESNV